MAKPELMKLLSSKLSPAGPGAPAATDPVMAADLDTNRAARLGMWVLGLGLGGFVLWAAFAPLDEGVPSQGVVAIDTKRKAVQHPTGGIVKEVHVREGDVVKEGQLLIK